MDLETFSTGPGMDFNIEIGPAPADGKRYPVVVLVHGNLGLAKPFGDQLRDLTQEIAKLGYIAALPSFYRDGQSHMDDLNIAAHVPTLTAAVKHLSGRSDADHNRLGLVGFSLGGGIAMSYITASPAGTVKAFADFYGYVEPLLGAGVSKFPPTIIFHNVDDPVVEVVKNSGPLAKALDGPPKIENEYHEYRDNWAPGFFHAFRPDGPADVDSRDRTKVWLTTHLPPIGKP